MVKYLPVLVKGCSQATVLVVMQSGKAVGQCSEVF